MRNYMLEDNFYRPPLLFDLMESKVNFGNENHVPIRQLAENFRTEMFDFDYTLSSNITKQDFECMIINHFLFRRIGSETFLSFKIRLQDKLLEILPYYNKILDSFGNWDIFSNGMTETESITEGKTKSENQINGITSNGTQNGTQTSDRKYSKTPQNELQDVRDGKYITDYNYDTDTTSVTQSNTSNENRSLSGNENITHNRMKNIIDNNKMELYKSYLENKQSIMNMIYNDLDCLFYQLVDF